MTDQQLREEIVVAYREGRRSCIRIGQLLEDKRQSLGGTSRGGTPVKSKFWTWFEEQMFPFSRNTAENYLMFARDPMRYELHCEQVRKRSASQRQIAVKPSYDTVNVGLPSELYQQVKKLAWKKHRTVNEIIEAAVTTYLEKNS